MVAFLRILRLLSTALTPAIAAVLVHIGIKKIKPFSRLNYWLQQLIIGVIFALFAVLAFLFGVKYTGKSFGDVIDRTYDQLNLTYGTANASPLIAGLAFGWPAGIIAGFLSGIFRTFCHPFGVDDVLRAPNAIGVLLAGIIGALLRKFLFDNKKPKWGYAFLAGLLVEVLHCTLILLVVGFIRNDVNYSYGLVAQSDIAVVACVSVATALALFLIAIAEEEKISINIRDQRLAAKIQKWMLVGLGTTFLAVGVLTFLGTYGKNYRDLTTEMMGNSDDCQLALKTEWEICEKAEKSGGSSAQIAWDGDQEEASTSKNRGALRAICLNKRIMYNGFTVITDSDSKIRSIYSEGDKEYYGQPYYVNKDPNKPITSLPLGTINICNVLGYNQYMYITKAELKSTTSLGNRTYYCVSVVQTEEVKISNYLQVRTFIYLEILAFIAIYTIIYTFIRIFVINNVIKINYSLNQITEGNLDERVNVRSNTEFSSLSDDINKTVDTLKGFIEEANRRFEKDLEIAKEIQHSSLPYIFPTAPEYDLYAYMKTAREVGGDFYDFFPLTDHHIFISIADVSGKGIPAAMFMMKSKTLIKSLLLSDKIPLNDVITSVNDELNDNNDAFMFVTAWFGIINLKKGKLTYVNAGHNPPLIKSNGKPFEYLKMKKNFVLGAMSNINYEMETIDFKPGDEIILYTDGVTEATSKSKELYGEKRLKEFVNKTSCNTSMELIDKVVAEVDKFQNGVEQADDITTLVVRMKDFKK